MYLIISDTIRDHYLAELRDYHIQYGGLNRLGEVNSGTLNLRDWVSCMGRAEFDRLGCVLLDFPEEDTTRPSGSGGDGELYLGNQSIQFY